MERSEPALVPEWLRSTASVTGGGSSSPHFPSSSLHSDVTLSALSSRNRSPRSVSDKDSPCSVFLDRSSSSNSRRSSSGTSSKHPYSSFNRNHRDKNREREKERSGTIDLWDHDASDPLGNILAGRVEKNSLRRSQSLVSRRPGEFLPRRTEDLKGGISSTHNSVNDIHSGGSSFNGNQKAAFEKDFPSLGIEERQVTRVSSPGLTSAVQSLPIGNSALLGGTDKWTSALAEVPPMVGSIGVGSSASQQSVAAAPTPRASSGTASLNMAEALSQAAPRARATAQIPDKTQRLEELAIKQSRQLIPVIPSMPKASLGIGSIRLFWDYESSFDKSIVSAGLWCGGQALLTYPVFHVLNFLNLYSRIIGSVAFCDNYSFYTCLDTSEVLFPVLVIEDFHLLNFTNNVALYDLDNSLIKVTIVNVVRTSALPLMYLNPHISVLAGFLSRIMFMIAFSSIHLLMCLYIYMIILVKLKKKCQVKDELQESKLLKISSSADKSKQPKSTARTNEMVGIAKSTHQPFSTQLANQPRSGQVRAEAPTTSHGKTLLVLKPGRENGVTSLSKEAPSPANNTGSRLATCPPAVAPSAPAVTSPTSRATSLETKAAALSLKPRSTAEKRSSLAQAQSRSDFFNLMRKKTSLNSSTVLPDSGTASSNSREQSGLKTKYEDSASLSPCVSENGSERTSNGDPHEAQIHVQRHNNVEENNLAINGALYPDEEEAAFLRSLGWDENAGEDEGLTEEEINNFYQEYMKLKPSLKVYKGAQPKCLMLPELHFATNPGTASSGSTSSDV
ncbi:hypothetical protein RND71_021251 [Anisodus tanguticus]|uniref:Uncharacterized protein n=1 Tax=Anisodus tanguticus TaxID=243964 RepID=A0AAE1RWV4_9SOLA|nr:hypothetical protein RND71_021251 [Anisodus tanguticus]